MPSPRNTNKNGVAIETKIKAVEEFFLKASAEEDLKAADPDERTAAEIIERKTVKPAKK